MFRVIKWSTSTGLRPVFLKVSASSAWMNSAAILPAAEPGWTKVWAPRRPGELELLTWMLRYRSARLALARSTRRVRSSRFLAAWPVVAGSLSSVSASRVSSTMAPACPRQSARRRPIARVMSFSRAPSLPAAPGSDPPCPGSTTITRFATDQA